MGKSKRSMNPADALRKQQRKRELKKNKEVRKTQRETVLAKKDIGKVKQDIARLEHLANTSQLDKIGQARLDELKGELVKIEKAKKATELTGAQAAYAARMQENEKKSELDARKLVFDPKSGKFVPSKKKESNKATHSESSGSESGSDSDSDSDDMDDSDEEIAIPGEEETEKEAKDLITSSDEEYEIPLPPGPPPSRAFDTQFQAAHQQQQRIPPPPPPGPPPFRGPVYAPNGRIPPPPPPGPPPFRGPYPVYNGRMAPPPPPPVMQYHHISRPVHYEQSPSVEPTVTVAPTISAEPQLRDLQKELIGFVPAALRRKQAAAKKTASLPKAARPHIDAAPSLEEDE